MGSDTNATRPPAAGQNITVMLPATRLTPPANRGPILSIMVLYHHSEVETPTMDILTITGIHKRVKLLKVSWKAYS